MKSAPLIRLAATLSLIVAASFIPRRVHAYEDYTSPRNADVNAAGARSIRIEAAAGILKVEGRADINQVRVRGTARSNRRSILDDIKLIAERRGDEIFIKADMPENRGFWDRARDDYDQIALDLRLLVDHRERLVRQRVALNNTLQWHLHDIWPELRLPGSSLF